MDRLEEIFQLQDKLNARFGWSQEDITSLHQIEQLQKMRNFLEALTIEAGEALKAAGGRWWKIDKDFQGLSHFQEECIDVLHFLISAFLASGGTADDLYRIYVAKNSHNHVREDWSINNEPSST